MTNVHCLYAVVVGRHWRSSVDWPHRVTSVQCLYAVVVGRYWRSSVDWPHRVTNVHCLYAVAVGRYWRSSVDWPERVTNVHCLYAVVVGRYWRSSAHWVSRPFISSQRSWLSSSRTHPCVWLWWQVNCELWTCLNSFDITQGGHPPGKPGEPGKIKEFGSGKWKVRETWESPGKCVLVCGVLLLYVLWWAWNNCWFHLTWNTAECQNMYHDSLKRLYLSYLWWACKHFGFPVLGLTSVPCNSGNNTDSKHFQA